MKLQKTFYGFLDKYLAYNLYIPFKNNNFKNQDKLVDPEAVKNAKWSILPFDDATRAKAWGFKSAL